MQSVSICTWNLWFDRLMQPERITVAMSELAATNADVICLQEVTESILAVIKSCPIISTYMILADEHSTKPYGQIFLLHRRFESHTVCFKSIPFPHTKMHRRIYELTLDKRYTVLNVHLESVFDNTGLSFPPIKKSQLDFLFAYAKQLGGYVIIAGDCNIGSSEETEFYRIISQNGFHDLNCGIQTYDSKTNSNIMDSFVCRLDRILCGNYVSVTHFEPLGTRPILMEKNYGLRKFFPSDHYGLHMKIHL